MPPAPRRPKSLSHGRPPSHHARTSSALPSSAASRTLIRAHHVRRKSLARATASGNTALAAALAQQDAAAGGLAAYQAASRAGQSAARGGDASRVLVGWLGEGGGVPLAGERRLRVLDVGAVTRGTAVGRLAGCEVVAVDLRGGAGVVQADFMEMEVPQGEAERFDVVCLSLVLNYVPDARGRGEMLKRVSGFLRRGGDGEGKGMLPALFMVLPAPCVQNARYLDQGRLNQIMESLGFEMVKVKVSAKLVYYLWRWDVALEKPAQKFPKVEVCPGKSRNNFAIVVD